MSSGLVRHKLCGLGFLAELGSPPVRSSPFGGAPDPRYVAPEQWQEGGAVDARTDLYSLAATVYRLLCVLTLSGFSLRLLLTHDSLSTRFPVTSLLVAAGAAAM